MIIAKHRHTIQLTGMVLIANMLFMRDADSGNWKTGNAFSFFVITANPLKALFGFLPNG
jgi:hypothetical protein